MEVARSVVAADGTRIAYRLTAARERAPGRAVVLLHGLASNMTRWSEFVEQTTLAARWDVIRLDLRGHGDSPTQRGIGLERWSEDLLALLDAEGHAQTVLVGHSLGAQVALHCAGRYPARVAGLALIDPVFRAALHDRSRWLVRLSPLVQGAALLVRALNALGVRRKHVVPYDLRKLDEEARVALLSKETTEEFVRRYSSPIDDIKHFRAAHYLQELVELFRPLPDPATIGAPVLLLLSRGATFTDTARTQAIAARFPRLETATIDAYHWPLTERPVEIRTAIEQWCERLAIA
jgi:pimeloyl-ACP methyl ester carboxylesterase